VSDRDWYRSEFANDYGLPAGFDHVLISFRGAQTPHTAFFVGVTRARGERPFSVEDRDFVELFHETLSPLLDQPRDQSRSATTAATKLTPRMRLTLERLLCGESDKEIAMHLGISRHTVHQYCKAIYRAHGVTGRTQLLARARRV
jgi:DNA-binding CsgD family transcriptional regulator